MATDAAKQEKFLEGLNDELGVQLTVATFSDYQNWLIRLSFLKASTSRWRIVRGSTVMGSITREFNRNLATAHTQGVLDQAQASLEGITITMGATFIMEGMDTTTMVTSRAMVMEEMAIDNISILPH